MNVRLTRLVVENFRGIRNQSLPLNGKSLLLVGENGSGKSSFVDAIEYLFTGGLERLKRRRDVKEKQSIPFVKATDEEVYVRLTCQASGQEVCLEATYPYQTIDIPKEIRDWFDLARSCPFILRRAQILKFVEAKGAERYRQISTLIGLEEVDEIEKIWRNLKNQWGRQRETAAAAVQNATRELQRLAEADRAEESLVVREVNQRLKQAGSPSIANLQELPQRRQEIQVSQKITEAAQRAAQLTSLAARLKELAEKIQALINRYNTFYTEWEEFARAQETLKEALFRVFLEQGKKLLEQYPELEECPLCRAPISHDALLKEVHQRLTDLEDIRRKQEALERQLTSLRDEVTTLCQLAESSREGLEDESSQETVSGVKKGLDEMRKMLRQKVLGGSFLAPQDLQQVQWVQDLADLLRAAEDLEKRAQDLQPSRIERQRMELVVWLEQVEKAWQELEQERDRLERIGKVYQHVDKVHAALIEAREDRLREIHHQIEKRVNDYYHRLHPEEGYGDIQLPMESKGKGVGLRTCFYEVESTHPLGFYSEAHLDTLGIAVFLAFIKGFGDDLRLLVLDDVLTTVDGGHRQRVASLLCEEFADYQMIITTHDRLWAERLLNTMRSAGLQCMALHLRPWDVENGVDCTEFLEERWGEYRERAKDHVSSAVADTGRDLEKFLYRMRYNLHLSVPARYGDRYTIGDLYDPFFSWFRKRSVQHPDRSFKADLENLRAQLDVYWRQRNWAGAHYNEWGENLSYKEAVEFIDLVEQLVGLFRCPRCGSLVEYDLGSSVLFCRRCKGKQDGALWQVIKGKTK